MLGTPFIPDEITVHLGTPDSDAPNVTISFPSYIKNSASSEIYPTWPEDSLRANIHVIVSYALNRIYTEWYHSRGYDFDITNTTQYDQAYVHDRDIFENISMLVDELFSTYVVKNGATEPYFTAFCNGTTALCEGLSQWGTVELARQGLSAFEILQYYYGTDISLVKSDNIRTNTPSYPGADLSEGIRSESVRTIQIQLNRISRNYPAIPKIPEVDGYFTTETTNAVKRFQEVFNLDATGVVNRATWYKVAYIFTSVKHLSELNSEGISISEIVEPFDTTLSIGMEGNQVKAFQYYLAVIGAYYEKVNPIPVTGYFGSQTENSVKSFQTLFGLPVTGTVDLLTWNNIYDAYEGILESYTPVNNDIVVLYPGNILREGSSGQYVKILQQYLSFISKTYPDIPAVTDTGYFGPLTRNSVIAFQKKYGFNPNGIVGAGLWNDIAGLYSDLKFGKQKQPYQYPGYIIK